MIPPQPPPTLPAVLATSPPAALASALAEENLKKKVAQSKEFSDSSGREVAELDLKQGKAGKGPAANVLVLNLVARLIFRWKDRLCSNKQVQEPQRTSYLTENTPSAGKTPSSIP